MQTKIQESLAIYRGVSLITGLDSPLECGTGMWDWNVGQESLIVCRPYNTLSTLSSFNPEVGTSHIKQSMGGCWINSNCH